MKKIVTTLDKIRELGEQENNLLLLTCLRELETDVRDLMYEMEKVIKSGGSKTCHENDPEDLFQDIHKFKEELKIANRINVSLDEKNQALWEQKDQLEEENKEFLTEINRLKAQLTREKEGPSMRCETLVQKAEAYLSKVVKENTLLKQGRNEFNNEHRHILRSEETKDLGIQTENIGTLQEGAELNDYYRKVVELKEKLNIANEDNKQLISMNNSLRDEVKQLKDSKLEVLQFNSTKETLFDEIRAANQQQTEDLDKSIQTEIKCECNSEATVPTGNEELSNATQDLNKKTSEVDTLTEKLKNKSKELDDANQALDTKTSEAIKLTQENSQLGEECKNTKVQLKGKNQQLDETTKTLENVQAQFKENKRELDVAKKNVLQLEKDLKQAKRDTSILNSQLTEQNRQLGKQLNSTQQGLDKKTSEVARLTGESKGTKTQLEGRRKELEALKSENNDLKTRLHGSGSKSEGLESRVKNLREKLESKNKELNGKNKKFLGASTHSKRQGNYASVSFVLSGAFAVGASLTIPYLAICITLAVAALTFLAVGFYCSYKANTTLSNVEVKNGIDSTAVEV
ncbi:hypothetical protein [Wolbachia endosymbiont (group A) of Lasioglossum fulvicorne]|uniref:TomO hydrophobic C-terminal domain-containing protein n=1 Tax=Wolbachia endosymbiont (group A) of Lasioglossum fulvicorne TaxID=3066201 RepID=UPI00333F609C